MLVGEKEYLFAGRLTALTSRNETAMRDIYDVWYFAKNNWDISTEILKIMADKTIQEHLADCIAIIENVKDNQILQGLGELLSEKEKMWVKTDLRKETVFLLKNYLSALKERWWWNVSCVKHSVFDMFLWLSQFLPFLPRPVLFRCDFFHMILHFGHY